MPDRNTTVVIIGGTGDLAQRKLVPALVNLARKRRVAEDLRVVGFARRNLTDDAYRDRMWDATRDVADLGVSHEEWLGFARQLYFVRGDLNNRADFEALGTRLGQLESDQARPSNRLYYPSIAPDFFETTLTNLAQAGLAEDSPGWRRVVIEKPFGSDLVTARNLNLCVRSVFAENQVYRIDHFLGKETVQNLLVFRFANTIFEPVWNRNFIDNVQITVSESLSVMERGAYYDQSGVVRDMVQNHLLPAADPGRHGAADSGRFGVPPEQEGRGPAGHPPLDTRAGRRQRDQGPVRGLPK